MIEPVAFCKARHDYLAADPATCANLTMKLGNFPVDRSSMSYAVWWNAAKRIAAGHDAAEQAQLFEGTARRVYRL